MRSQLCVAGPLCAIAIFVACGSVGSRGSNETSSRSASLALDTTSHSLPRGVARPRPNGVRPAAARPAHLGAPSQQLIYFGGRIISNVQVVEVNWGTGVNSTWTAGFPGFYTTIPASPWMDLMSEYETTSVPGQDGSLGTSQRVGHGGFVGAYTITPNEPATTISDIDVQQELQQQILAGNLPMPTLDAFGFVNTIYMVDFPPPIVINLYNAGSTAPSCISYGAYHSTMLFQGNSVPYGVHPDCGFDFTTATSIHSHELAEAVTDTEVGLVDPDLGVGITRPGAWYSFIGGVDSGEIGDLCEVSGGDVMVSGYNVQTIWSNSQGGCIGTSPTLICDGASPAIPGCRACTAADNGVACNGARSFCETNASSFKFGQCVVCTLSSECSPPNNSCTSTSDPTDDTCVDTTPCTGSGSCFGTTPICDTGTQSCRPCQDADCTGATPACEKRTSNVYFGQCVVCTELNLSACATTTNFCDIFNNTCVECVFNEDCPQSAPVCSHPVPGADAGVDSGSPAAHTCGPCTSTSDCEVPNTCAASGGCVSPSDGGAESSTEAGSDAGFDAGMDAAALDSGSPLDAAPGLDAATPLDAGNGDSGTAPKPDAGPNTGADAEANADGGSAGSTDTSGCGCTTAGRPTSEAAGIAGLALALACFRRRRRG